ncbi:hypothetical protein PsorP6_014912 [Peronosclerospora sorghi]|uniref:Uncharacterized protein n=1 Tax=Peronosclerospora sorghi TaxID=230839 RepID=A0ACC0VU67_9STRA|nr:hypothetical protein PsorP6_014912 [Peronosclerospora sorghi]
MTVFEVQDPLQCDFTRVWEVNASNVQNQNSLQQQHVHWSRGVASAIAIANDVMEFHPDPLLQTLDMSLTGTTGTGPKSLHRLAVRTQLPEHGQATFQVHLPVQHPLTMTLASAPTDAARNEILVRSSQNTSVLAQVPCLTDIAHTYHTLEFVWDHECMRWYMDEMLLWEEFMYARATLNVTTPLAMTITTTTTLAIDHITFTTANASDPVCAPRYTRSIACRTPKSFTPRRGSLRGALSLTEVNAFLQELTTTFPHLTKLDQVGASVENRPIHALCLGACHAPSSVHVPQALYTGLHHARENLVYTIDRLTRAYENGDAHALYLLASRQLWFILVVNPDAYAQNEERRVWETETTGLRKNAARTCPQRPADAGVDLNRNYDVCFARDAVGSSSDPCHDDYQGRAAFSEPETRAVRALVERATSNFSLAFNYHAYGRRVNLPFACQGLGAPRAPFAAVFHALAHELTRTNGFDAGPAWNESHLYTVNGEASDWMWHAHGIVAMSPEVGPAFDTPVRVGFWPLETDVPALAAELYAANLVLARRAGPVYEVTVLRLARRDAGLAVHVSLANRGFRPARVDVMASFSSPGRNGSDAVVLDLDAAPAGSGHEHVRVTHVLELPYTRAPHGTTVAVFLLVRDALSCHLVRIAVHFVARPAPLRFQAWQSLALPRCGACRAFGAPRDDHDVAPRCAPIDDVAGLVPVLPTRAINVDRWPVLLRPLDPRTTTLVVVSLSVLALVLAVVALVRCGWFRGRTRNNKKRVQYARVDQDTASPSSIEAPHAVDEEDRRPLAIDTT